MSNIVILSNSFGNFFLIYINDFFKLKYLNTQLSNLCMKISHTLAKYMLK